MGRTAGAEIQQMDEVFLAGKSRPIWAAGPKLVA